MTTSETRWGLKGPVLFNRRDDKQDDKNINDTLVKAAKESVT